MIYDISAPLSSTLKVWPGDMPLRREFLSDAAHGAACNTSALHATAHLGAHADAPSHFDPKGQTIDQMDLDYFLGPCQVIRVPVARGQAIFPDTLKTPVVAQRVLFATGTYPNPAEFNEDFAALSSALVAWLYAKGVKLVGIDTPSIDLFGAGDLPAHKAVMQHRMAVLEGLALDEVPEGLYELIALPLKLVGFEASPVRAVLRVPEPRPPRH